MTSIERYICVAAVSAALTLAAVQSGSPASKPALPEVVRAHAFELVDVEGRVIAELRADAGGNAMLAMRNSNKEVAIHASAASPGGSVRFYSSDQKEQAGVEVIAGSVGGEITTKNRGGQVISRLATSQRDLGGELVLYDAAGIPTHLLARTPASGGQFAAFRAGTGFWASPDK